MGNLYEISAKLGKIQTKRELATWKDAESLQKKSRGNRIKLDCVLLVLQGLGTVEQSSLR
jgi:hypothetical protein